MTVVSTTASSVGLARRLADYFGRRPEDRARYAHVRASAGQIRPSQYDISNTCNLTCEGCLFFAGDDHLNHEQVLDAARIDAFFAQEAARGVNFLQFGGAEPALTQQTLRIAARHVRRGVVFTNGTVKIARDIPFRLHVSVWGLGEQARALRGADVVAKAVRNYRGDPRALFVFTVNAGNVESIPDVAAYCAEAGVPLTFNHFANTLTYERWLDGEQADPDYFRLGQAGTGMTHTPATLARAWALIGQAIERYPETVVYSRAFGRRIHDPRGLYQIDPKSGEASDCGSRVGAHYRHFHADLADAGDVKCCTPNIDCATCRLYQQSLSSLLARLEGFAVTDEGLGDWLELWEFWCRLNLVGWRPGTSSAQPAAEAQATVS